LQLDGHNPEEVNSDVIHSFDLLLTNRYTRRQVELFSTLMNATKYVDRSVGHWSNLYIVFKPSLQQYLDPSSAHVLITVITIMTSY